MEHQLNLQRGWCDVFVHDEGCPLRHVDNASSCNCLTLGDRHQLGRLIVMSTGRKRRCSLNWKHYYSIKY